MTHSATVDAALAPDAVLWEAPAFGAPASPPAVAALEDIERAAREEGYAAGHAEGFGQGQAEVRRLLARLESLLDAFRRPLAGLDADVEGALAELATQIAGTLLRAHYAAAPQALAQLVHEAVASVGDTARHVDVRLHPDDLVMLKPLLADVSKLTADMSLSRGDVRVHADSVRVDARLATRLDAVLAELGSAQA